MNRKKAGEKSSIAKSRSAHTYIQSFESPARISIASGTTLGLPQLVHLGHSLLELVVLALLVAMTLILCSRPVSLQFALLSGLGDISS